MNGTHLGGQRENDPLKAWRALAAAVILQALRDAREQPALCQGHPQKSCQRRGCARCARAFLKSEDGLAILSTLLGFRCTPEDVREILICPMHLPYHPRKNEIARLQALVK